ncbi:uncharacterized protein [Venturia canescens]|uniref:uncharacterized protein n=1 Tax=Venturia canescens TaxID=32260 RepID=UPI001C9CD358|nr:uncharacterized protein LOC122415719 [Venturia canescens]
MTLPPLFANGFPASVRDSRENQVDVYWYQQDFAQSRYPPGQCVSEACTLICLLVAQRICQTGLILWNVNNCSKLNIIIAEAILEGNRTHAWIVRNGLIPHPYLNTNEALQFGGKRLKTLTEWKFRVYRESIEKALCKNIESFLHEWYQKPKAETLFMLLITCGRTVLFIFQEQTYKVTLFDSHGHSTPRNGDQGLVIAQTTMEKLQYLCDWYIEAVLYNCFNVQAHQYELAFLHENCRPSCCKDNLLCNCGCLEC